MQSQKKIDCHSKDRLISRKLITHVNSWSSYLDQSGTSGVRQMT